MEEIRRETQELIKTEVTNDLFYLVHQRTPASDPAALNTLIDSTVNSRSR